MWLMKDLSHELGISASEISESLHRSAIAGLISEDKKTLMRLSILEFLEHGLRYVYPQRPGALVRGLPTAHSAAPLNDIIVGDEPYVWPYAHGNTRGQAVSPLHTKVPEACTKDKQLYELLALCDALRVGKAREKKTAIQEIKKRLT
jgi:hypothetical protein